MRTINHWAMAAMAAAALALAGCGGGGSTATAPAGPGDDTPAPTNLVDLNGVEHGLMEAGDYDVPAGTTYKVAGVRFYCPTGGDDCTVSVAVDDEGAVTVTYDETGGTPTAMALSAVGYQSFDNLAAALLLAEDRGELMSMLYDEDVTPAVEDDQATTDVDETMAEVINGGGVTSSLTTHEQPVTQGDANTVTGVSDLFVSIDPAVDRANADDASVTVDIVDDNNLAETDEDGNEIEGSALRDDAMIANPVLVDDDGEVRSNRTATFNAIASWAFNPAEDWMSALTGMEPADPKIADIWTYVLDTGDDGMTLPGGRTLHLELRSDFDPNITDNGAPLTIARGPGELTTDPGPVSVSWDDIELDGIGDLALGGELDLGDGIMGTYMGVRGMFTCVNAATTDGNQICRINHHENGELNVSEEDTVTFTPLVYMADSDWLSAGVWITVPDDPEGDYSIGGFAFGNDQYKRADQSAVNAITGMASYNGQAFGYFAEELDGHKEVGSFTAEAALTANFGTATTPVPGSISGELNDFVANHQPVDWDVNFESAEVMLGMTGTGDLNGDGDENDPGESPLAVEENSALRFNAGASGHANGHGLTGYWNGQFYGSPADDATGDALQPGSVAGTFGLTTERDNEDSYSLTLGGAFGAHKEADGDSN